MASSTPGEEVVVVWALAIGWYVVGVLSGVAALELASRRSPLASGTGWSALVAFVFAWPVLLPIALVAHLAWVLEVRSQ